MKQAMLIVLLLAVNAKASVVQAESGVVLKIHESTANRFFSFEIDEGVDTSEFSRGMSFDGSSEISGNVSLNFAPRNRDAAVEVVLKANSHTLTHVKGWPTARIFFDFCLNSRTNAIAGKKLFLSAERVNFANTWAYANTRSNLCNLRYYVEGLPLARRLKAELAIKSLRRQVPTMSREISKAHENSLRQRIDQAIGENMSLIDKQLVGILSQPILGTSTRIESDKVKLSTTQDQFILQYLVDRSVAPKPTGLVKSFESKKDAFLISDEFLQAGLQNRISGKRMTLSELTGVLPFSYGRQGQFQTTLIDEIEVVFPSDGAAEIEFDQNRIRLRLKPVEMYHNEKILTQVSDINIQYALKSPRQGQYIFVKQAQSDGAFASEAVKDALNQIFPETFLAGDWLTFGPIDNELYLKNEEVAVDKGWALVAWEIAESKIGINYGNATRKGQYDLVALGDSITAGANADGVGIELENNWSTGTNLSKVKSLGYRLQELQEGPVKFRNVARIGATAKELLEQVREVRDVRARYFTITIGNNDVCNRNLENVNWLKDYERNLTKSLESIISNNPNSRIVIPGLANFREMRRIIHGSKKSHCEWRQNLTGFCSRYLGFDRSDEELESFEKDYKKIQIKTQDIVSRFQEHVVHVPEVSSMEYDETFISMSDCFHPSTRGQNYLSQVVWEKITSK